MSLLAVVGSREILQEVLALIGSDFALVPVGLACVTFYRMHEAEMWQLAVYGWSITEYYIFLRLEEAQVIARQLRCEERRERRPHAFRRRNLYDFYGAGAFSDSSWDSADYE